MCVCAPYCIYIYTYKEGRARHFCLGGEEMGSLLACVFALRLFLFIPRVGSGWIGCSFNCTCLAG